MLFDLTHAHLCVWAMLMTLRVTHSADPYLPDQRRRTVVCDERNSCVARGTKYLTFKEQNCFCDTNCELYGDCCHDYDGRTHRRDSGRRRGSTKRGLECVGTEHFETFNAWYVYMVTSCPRGFREQKLRRNCENIAFNDTFQQVPVSGVNSSVLYRNYYCALCHGESDVEFWSVKVECTRDPREGNQDGNQSQVFQNTLQRTQSNDDCKTTYNHPAYQARPCKPSIDSCDKDWTGPKSVRRECRRGPTSYTYLSTLRVFRNSACATCNHHPPEMNRTSCDDTFTLPTPPMIFNPFGSFAMLLDLNDGRGSMQPGGDGGMNHGTGSQVELRQCPDGHVYDPFTNICREIFCPNGQVFTNGRCNIPVSTAPASTPTTSQISSITTPAPTLKSTPGMPPEQTETTARTIPSSTTRQTRRGGNPRKNVPFTIGHASPTPTLSLPADDREWVNDISAAEGAKPSPDIWIDRLTVGPELSDLPDCAMILLSRNEYQEKVEGSIYVPAYGREFFPGEFVKRDDLGGALICTPDTWTNNITSNISDVQYLTMFHFDDTQGLVSAIGLVISLSALVVTILVYVVLPDLRNVPGKCVLSLSIALFAGQLLFLCGVKRTSSPTACVVIAISMHYAFLAVFSWMNVMAVDIFRTFSAQISRKNSSSSRFVYYSLYAWGAPAVVVAATVALHYLDVPGRMQPRYGDEICWIRGREALLFLFALPAGVLLFINITLFVCTVRNLVNISKTTKMVHEHKSNRLRFLLYVKLCLILGGGWILGFIATITNSTVIWYLFIVFNTIQGVFIFLAFVCTRKTVRLLRKLGRGEKPTIPTSKTMSSVYSNGSACNGHAGDPSAEVVAHITSL